MNCNELLVQLLLASVVVYGCDALLCLNVKWLVLAVSYDRAVSDDALLVIVICNEKKVWSAT